MYGSQEAAIYDTLICHRKSYPDEAKRLHELIQQYKRSEGNTLLDVACGTGLHLVALKELYQAEGTDLSAHQLEIARGRHPDLLFTQADMAELNLGKQFDIVVCLFSSISCVGTLDRMQKAVSAMAQHVKVGGVLMIEPWIRKEHYRPGTVYSDFVDLPEIKIAQMIRIAREGDLCVMDIHYMVGRLTGIEEFTERQEMGLFSSDEYLSAIEATGFTATYDKFGLMGLGLYIGVKDGPEPR